MRRKAVSRGHIKGSSLKSWFWILGMNPLYVERLLFGAPFH
ncbi:hypothetical protein HMPREF9104_01035 [Lentilactobacillus kisonensis F0435]|uniref:Uncharacterized protein n=1 Tax=Lentilactobacillus kisonensis F0435 TaxID=797516 RepID=H1LEK9_9LACO|nr:hypothetical protein HMPREF9104_01035 [Lentilactobacillus kisonensis F0435]